MMPFTKPAEPSAGMVAGRVTANAAGHREGACIALNMAAALGYLDARQQRAVIRMLATAVNPDVDLFPGGQRAIVRHATPWRGAAVRPISRTRSPQCTNQLLTCLTSPASLYTMRPSNDGGRA